MSKKTIVSILIAAVVVVILFGVVAIAGFAYFVRSHVTAASASETTALAEIANERQRFAGQTPLLERRRGDDDERFVVHHPESSAHPAPVHTLRVLAYNPSEGRMLRVNIPFWLIRLAPSAKFNMFDGTDIDVGQEHLTVEDLERHGPGLILDTTDDRGARVLVWLE